MGSHFAMAPASRGAFSHGGFSPRFSHFAFHDGRFHHGFFHHRFRRFAFFGAPYYDDYGYSGCVRQVWTRYGLQWVNVCGYGNVY
jgi:hypothetical protein